MKQKNETKLNNFLRKNKTIFMFTFLLVFLGGLAIATTISDTGITTPTGTYTNLTADRINDVLYVQAGNGSDIQAKINLCSGNLNCDTVIVPKGSYTITSSINLLTSVNLFLSDETEITTESNIYMINLSQDTTLRGGKLRVNVDNYDKSAIYINPIDKIEVFERIKIFDLEMYQLGDGSGTGLLIETPDNGDKIVFSIVQDLIIQGFNKSIHLSSTAPDGDSYINGMLFENIIGSNGEYMFYLNATGNNDIADNIFTDIIMQSSLSAKAMFFSRVESGNIKYNVFRGQMIDRPGGALHLDLDLNTTKNMFVGNFQDGEYDDPGNNNMIFDWDGRDLKGIQKITINPNITSMQCNEANTGTIYYDDSLNNHYSCNGTYFGQMSIVDKLTFRLGEIIDNLVDGWVRITGNLKVTGMIQTEMNTTAMTCNEANAGAIYYNNDTNKHYGCNITGWQGLY